MVLQFLDWQLKYNGTCEKSRIIPLISIGQETRDINNMFYALLLHDLHDF